MIVKVTSVFCKGKKVEEVQEKPFDKRVTEIGKERVTETYTEVNSIDKLLKVVDRSFFNTYTEYALFLIDNETRFEIERSKGE